MGFFKKEKSAAAEALLAEDGDVSSKLQKIAEHLVMLEQKLDTLLSQSRDRKPFNPQYNRHGQANGPYRGQRPYGQRDNRHTGPHAAPRPYRSGGHSGGHQSQGNFQKKVVPTQQPTH